MYCPSCNAENLETSIRCIQCGQDITGINTKEDTSSAAPELWNPDVAAAFSWVLTPIFGAIIHALNWHSLGQQRKARLSWGWAIFLLVGLIAMSIYIQGIFNDPKTVDRALGAANIVMLIIWYFLFGRSQSKFLAKQLNGKYRKAGWLNPLCITTIFISSIFIIGGQLK